MDVAARFRFCYTYNPTSICETAPIPPLLLLVIDVFNIWSRAIKSILVYLLVSASSFVIVKMHYNYLIVIYTPENIYIHFLCFWRIPRSLCYTRVCIGISRMRLMVYGIHLFNNALVLPNCGCKNEWCENVVTYLYGFFDDDIDWSFNVSSLKNRDLNLYTSGTNHYVKK